MKYRPKVDVECVLIGCHKPIRYGQRGMCVKHFQRWKRHGDPTKLVNLRHGERLCKEEGCPIPTKARGWCPMHYQRWRKYGDPNTVRKMGRPKAAAA